MKAWNKRIFCLALCLLLALGAVGCARERVAVSPKAFERVEEQLAAGRSVGGAWSEEELRQAAAYMQPFEAGTVHLEDWSEGEAVRAISMEEAAADVDALLALLRACYSGYDYFGGDAVFEGIREQLLGGLPAIASPYSPPSRKILTERFEKLLYETLAEIIVDAHLEVGEQGLIQQHRRSMYFVPDLFLTPEQVPEEMRPYLRPTIGPDGAAAFWFACLSVDGSGLPERVSVDGAERTLSWQRAEPAAEQEGVFQYSSSGAVPILRLSTLTQRPDTLEQLSEFAGSGERYRDTSLLVIDLRGNRGGNSQFSHSWLTGYLGCEPSVKSIQGQKCSQLWLDTVGQLLDNEALAEHYHQVQDHLGAWYQSESDAATVENPNRIFVLVDQRTGSSAENFVRELRTLPHTLVVGSNTAGAGMFTNAVEVFLPNSKLRVQFGTQLCLYDSMENTEGIGIQPDLWVEPQRAEAAVKALCAYYQLDREAS